MFAQGGFNMTQGSGNYSVRWLAILCATAAIWGLLFSGCPQPEGEVDPDLPQYTITFESHGGSDLGPITANEGTAVNQPADPAKEGYSFLGWFDAEMGGTLYSWPHTLTGNITMHAQWQDDSQPPPMQYTITFDSHGGTDLGPITANEGTAVNQPADPAKEGYSFLGWFDTAAGGAKYAWPHTLIGNITMHAQWQDNSQPPPTQYTITFDSHGGTDLGPITANEGTAVSKPADPAKAGYSFLGWFDMAAGGVKYAWPYTLTGNIIMHAQWQDNSQPPPTQYTITFDSNGGSPVQSLTANEGTAVSKPADPAKAGYNFLGWYNTMGGLYTWPHTLTGNVSMRAQWAAISYTVSYNSNGGDGTMTSSAHTYDAPQNLSTGAFTRTGYNFAGWTTEANGSGTPYADGASVLNLSPNDGAVVTLYARWAAISYTVSYNANFGSGDMSPSTHTYDVQKNLSANAFIRTGYSFGGWTTGADGSGTPYADGASVSNLSPNDGAVVTLYARWTAISYTVEYKANGGSGTMTPSTHTYGVPQNLSANAFTRTGYIFVRWTTEANGNGTQYADGESVSGLSFIDGAAVSLYAQWRPINYTVTYNANGGIGTMWQSSHTYDVPQNLNANTFTKGGYIFGGWTAESDGSGAPYADEAGVLNLSSINGAEVNLYARWTTAYTVEYNANGGIGTMPPSAHIYGVPQNLSANTFTKNSYIFEGWTTESNGSGTQYPDEASVSNLSSINGAVVTLYARWTGISYTVKYNANGGSGTMPPSAHTYDESKNLSANAFTRSGYSFERWTTESDGSGTQYADGASVLNLSSTGGAEINLYARWTGISYTVAYNASGGSGTMPPSAHTYDESKNLSANAFTKTGYSFAGWTTESNGSGTQYPDGASVSNLSSTGGAEVTLYARWTAIAYTVKYNVNGGSGAMPPSAHTYDAPQNLSVNAFTRSGYSFGAGLPKPMEAARLTPMEQAY
jgi:uncharacterized repeat protein (TIGR02543 family)